MTPLAWTAHPAKRRPQDAMLAAMVIFATAWAVLVSLGSGLLAIVAALLLLVAIAPFLFPTHYRLDADGVAERRGFVRRHRAWTELRRLEIGARAALVSPYATPRALDRYRGITIYFDGAPRDQIVEALRAHMGRT